MVNHHAPKCRACGNLMYVGLGVEPPKCDFCERKTKAAATKKLSQNSSQGTRHYNAHDTVYTPAGVSIGQCFNEEEASSIVGFLNDVDRERRAERARSFELVKAIKAIKDKYNRYMASDYRKLVDAALKDFNDADPQDIPF